VKFFSGLRREFLLLLVAAPAVLAAASVAYGTLGDLDPPAVPSWFAGLGGWTVPVFLAVRTAMVVFGLPTWMLTLAGGALFGLVAGSLYSVASAALGAVIAFGIARALGRERVMRRLGHHRWLVRLDRRLCGQAFWGVLSLRLNPLAPFNLVNLALGITSVRPGPFVAATLLGITPGTVVYTWLGESGRDALSGEGQAAFFVALILLGFLSLVPLPLPRPDAEVDTPDRMPE